MAIPLRNISFVDLSQINQSCDPLANGVEYDGSLVRRREWLATFFQVSDRETLGRQRGGIVGVGSIP